MQEILPAVELAEKVLKIQKRRNAEQGLRRMLFCIEQKTDDGLLLYNLMTKRMILLKEGEELNQQQELFDKWFLVEEGFDDLKGCSQLNGLAAIYQKRNKGITSYTILPTTGCNARCFYCFEQGAKPVHMNVERAISVAKYIERNHGDEKISINWFGGEPLMGVTAIDTISQYLSEHDIAFSSRMVSNGYLITPEIVEKAKNLWKLSRIQITLDGTEEVYNKAKAYVYKLGSPYKRVINNIRLLAESGIKVNIRLNIDLYNADDLMKLADDLYANFHDLEKVKAYSHVIFEKDGEERSDEDRKLLYQKQKELEAKLSGYGLFASEKPNLQRQIKLNFCGSDNDASVLIAPDGSLGKCEHFVDRDFFGHVDSEVQDKSMLAKFKKRRPAIEACNTCPLFPECIRLEVCSELRHCYPEERAQRLERIKRAMVAEYEGWKEKKEKE